MVGTAFLTSYISRIYYITSIKKIIVMECTVSGEKYITNETNDRNINAFMVYVNDLYISNLFVLLMFMFCKYSRDW